MLEKVKKYLPIISGLLVTLGAFSKQVSPYVNGFNLSFVLVIFAYLDWHMGIGWRRHRGKKVLSGWTLVRRLAKKLFGSLLPFTFELAGYLFGLFITYFNMFMPFANIPVDSTRFLFSWLAIASFVAIAYDGLLSMVANWWLSGHILPDKCYDWARDEIFEKLYRTVDSHPFNTGGNEDETI
ncbi:hypothetical protein [Weissella sp. MSCH1]|uniref:hypothetical protein n=1 Tax=Weissella sp. MSCH1 TaxID=3383343 RepID=UPI003896C87E